MPNFRALWLIQLSVLLMPMSVQASNPLASGGRMIIEESAGSLRLTLQIHEDFLKEDLKKKAPEIFSEKIFALTLKDHPIRFSDGRLCQWKNPGATSRSGIVNLQIIAICPSEIDQLDWNIGFLRQLPSYFTLYVEAFFQKGEETFVLTPDAHRLSLRDIKFMNSVAAGSEFVGLTLSAWVDTWGIAKIPKGSILILVFVLCLIASQQLADFLVLMTLVILLHWLAPLLTKVLPLSMEPVLFGEIFLVGLAVLAPLLFFLRRRTAFIYLLISFLGLFSGMSFLQSGQLFQGILDIFYFNVGSSFIYLLASFTVLPWFVLILRSGLSHNLMAWILLGLAESSVVCFWLFA